jgi:sensor c-di-GMP phosphodiesterase-like protein
MELKRFNRHPLLPWATTIVAAVVGALFGYLISCTSAVKSAHDKLEWDATQIEVVVGAYLSESQTVLAAINASPYPFCSDAELSYVRQLVFHAEYIRDAGRMRDGKIDCSATLGWQGIPAAQFKPDITEPDGTKIYRDLPPYRAEGELVFTSQQGGAFVVRDPRVEKYMRGINQNYTVTIPDTAERTFSLMSGKQLVTNGIITNRDNAGRSGNTLFVTRCLDRSLGCITAYTTVTDSLWSRRGAITNYTILGSFAAAFLGLVFGLYVRQRSGMVEELRRAIAKGKLQVVYQPIVNLVTRRIVGAEALVRWTTEDGDEVVPDRLSALAERNGFASSLTRMVVRRALADLASNLRSRPQFQLNINVAAADLADPQFLPMLEESTQNARVPARSLTLEITERSTVRKHKGEDVLRRIGERGYGVCIDDFGTGYSSLSYLQDLPVNAIKIDKAFTRAVGTKSASLMILPKILAMAAALNLEVVVEGIETEEQARFFQQNGQSLLGQGWLFGHPVSAEEFQLMLASDEVREALALLEF